MSTAEAPGYRAEPYDFAAARRLMAEFDLAEPVAIALVRRGLGSVEAAREFLAADESHDPSAFAGIGDAVATIEDAITGCERITVHGDYDVDGICSTTILVSALRRAGAECDWLIPDRLGDGYGLGERSLEELRSRGTGLLITADCGIASADEVERAKADGIEVVVTDHHHPGDRLPDCPIVHPVVSGYPFEGLCGAAVAHKLVLALERGRGIAGEAFERRDLDLVALATIADLVPLVGENRSLARRGLHELRLARRPGVRALIAGCSIEPERLDEGDIAFRLAPRLNAAGRLYRADAGVELMLTTDDARARAIASELDAANHERRETERGVSNEAEAALRDLPDEDRSAPALVLAGEGWHPGVVGIVASRIVERHGRPAVVLSVDSETGRAKGSGRSVPGFDLLAALDACAEHLDRYGGHRAAAGVELEADRVEAFRAAFADHAREVAPDGGLRAPERVDAVVGADALDLRVAEQFESLAPFGQGNPEIKLLVPGARIADVRPMGEEGKHARFQLSTGAVSARGVAFNANGTLSAAQRSPHDITVRLEVNHWNGGVEPRAVLAGAHPRDARPGGDGHGCPEAEDGVWWWERFDRELERPLEEDAPGSRRDGGREVLDARAGSPVARIAELLSSGARVLVIAADAGRRSALAGAVGIAGAGSGATVCLRCPPQELTRAAAGEGRLLLTDWATLAAAHEAAAAFGHVVAVDPPATPAEECAALSGAGFLHRAWGLGEDLAELCWDSEWELRPVLADVYRALTPGRLAGEELRRALIGPSRYGRTPEAAARCARVLCDLGIAERGGDGDARWIGVVSSKRTELERSGAWRAYSRTHQEGRRFLQSLRTQR